MGTIKSKYGARFVYTENLVEQSWPIVFSVSPSTIPALTPVALAGWDTAKSCPIIMPTFVNSNIVIGITSKAIAPDEYAYDAVIYEGTIENINTSGWSNASKLYATTSGTITNSATDPATIAQPIGFVLYCHSTLGAIRLSGINFVQGITSIINKIITDADTELEIETKGVIIKKEATLLAANKYLKLWHDGTDAFIKSFLGVVNFWNKIVSRHSSDTDGTKQIEVYHDGTDGFIEPKTGILKTNNKDLSVGTGKVITNKIADTTDLTKIISLILSQATGTTRTLTMPDRNVDLSWLGQDVGASATLVSFANIADTGLTASQIVETDASKKLISAAKGTAYNKNFGTGTSNIPEIGATLAVSKNVETDSNGKLITADKPTSFPGFGTTAGTACEGNDSRLSDTRNPVLTTVGSITMLVINTNVAIGANNTDGEKGTLLKVRLGESVVKGNVLSVSTTADNKYIKQTNEYDATCIAAEAGSADGFIWVWTTGAVCQVLFKDTIAPVRGHLATSADTDGRANAVDLATIQGNPAIDTHFKEIGHIKESKSAGTDVLALIHFHTL